LISLLQYNKKTTSYRLAIDILDGVKLSKNINQASNEETFIKGICKRVTKSTSVLYLLKNNDEILGLLSLSVTTFMKDSPSLQIDYIFVNEAYRGKKLEVLDNDKTSQYLIHYAVKTAKEIQTKVGLKYLVLLPDNDRLTKIYEDIGFTKFQDTDWMLIKLSDIS
jgi:GNAT superfamily N-acetyltransferase